MSRKEYRRLKKSREDQLIEKGRQLERRQQRLIKKRQEAEDLARRKKARRETDKLIKNLFKGKTLKQQVMWLHKETTLQEFIKMANRAGVRTRQAYAIWFSPEGAGAGIF